MNVNMHLQSHLVKNHKYNKRIKIKHTYITNTFKDYCLRSLGFGVIDINVSDDQVDDRIDETLQYFAQYHYDGVEKMYLKYQITQDDIDRTTSIK